MRKLPPLAALRAFEAAARHSSFKRAAGELAVTPTAISHQVRLLEATLGLQLFVRGTRRVDLTPAGRRLYPTLRDGFDAFEQTIAELGKPRREVLTLSATPLFTARWLVPRVDSFRAANPGVDLRLHATLEPVDLLGGEADAAIRYGRGPFPGLFSEPLVAQEFVPMCSPSLGLRHPDQLRDAPLLHSEWRQQGPDTPTWMRWGTVAAVKGVDWTRGVTFTDEAHVIQAAIAGQGVALLSPLLVSDELKSGSLVQPFGPALPGVHFHFVRPDDPRHAARSAALEAWLRAALS
ncbi:LysR substrate-binding domain-containing protein [Brevundimonas sp.]|uniref:LysR substrate-binding domain-containing protein n=1 Tax=Brevundimonas sp. TaxID=1871086 RepID=UPI002D260FE9|nr:LysR substrate-binding domain-containing protein [Brevundimonas sp.]HYC69253.1 LysR substrate-binding domain-containing protein [Brevundimonas sp.]